jgi:hypothetical protein
MVIPKVPNLTEDSRLTPEVQRREWNQLQGAAGEVGAGDLMDAFAEFRREERAIEDSGR